jgi:2-dehydropantoate 2-reductase
LWIKWTFLATLAAATTLYRGTVGQIMASARGAELVERMYRECLAVSAAHGFALPEGAQAKARSVLLAAGSDFTASMYRDLISGQRTEHEHVLGEMCRKAGEQGLDTPLMAAAWCHMQVESGQRG